MYNSIVGKQYHFLAGLHRSGNTVLSSILNQNPDIYSSPLSPVAEYMWRCHTAKDYLEYERSTQFPHRTKNLLSSMFDSYYADVEKPIVLDRDKNWAHPANINMIKECLDFKPKIIFTTRPIIEIMASFIAIDISTVIRWMNESPFKPNTALPLNDNLCDYLVSETSQLSRAMLAFESIDNPENEGMIYVIKYEDLLNAPQETMDKIYDFLETEKFKHNFTNIRKIEEYNEAAAGLPKDLHKVRRILGKSDVRVEDYLTARSIEKYKDLRYF